MLAVTVRALALHVLDMECNERGNLSVKLVSSPFQVAISLGSHRALAGGHFAPLRPTRLVNRRRSGFSIVADTTAAAATQAERRGSMAQGRKKGQK